MMERRTFLLGGAGLALIAGAGVWGADVFSQRQIIAGVRRKLSFLQLDDTGLHAFAKDYINSMLAKRPSWYRWKVHFHSLFAKPAAARWGISNDKRSKHEKLDDYLATLFLLSSDFFVKGADETQPVGYVNLYDPLRACGNPFARPPPDPTDKA
jgi:hypothetical protein